MSGTYTPLAHQAVDANWHFIHPNNMVGSAYVYDYPTAKPMAVIAAPWWSVPATQTSRWIAATTEKSSTNHDMKNAANGMYTAYSEFALTGPSSWWLVLDGTVWGSDRITQVDLFSVTANQVIATQTFGTLVSGSTGAAGPAFDEGRSFSFHQGGLASGTYRLRFTLYNDNNGMDYAGIRVQFDQGMHYATPEPVSSLLMLTGGSILAFVAHRRRRKRQSVSA